jgi:peroxiredoxin
MLDAQEPESRCIESPATSASASKVLSGLDSSHRSRLKKAAASSDPATLLEFQAERIADLNGYLNTFGGARQAIRVRMEIGQIALSNPDHRESARRALGGFRPAVASPGVGILAVQLAGKLKFHDIRSRLMVAVTAEAESIGARVRFAALLRDGMGEHRWSDDVRAATEKLAVTSEQRAELMLNRAEVARPKSGLDRSAYDAALARVAATFPGTVSGKLAIDKIAASELEARSLPVRFTAKDMDGRSVSLSDYSGHVLLIDFWATWSMSCMKRIPVVVAMHRRHQASGLEILGISLDHATERDHLSRVIKENQMLWRHVYDGGHWLAGVARQYDVDAVPFNVLIGRDGRVVATGLHGAQLDAAIQEALAAK